VTPRRPGDAILGGITSSGSDPMQRLLVTIGLVLVVVGLLWPWIGKLGLGRLPGDIRIEKEGFSFYFPLTTGILVSLAISVIVWIFRR